jgi:hypothetical protein
MWGNDGDGGKSCSGNRLSRWHRPIYRSGSGPQWRERSVARPQSAKGEKVLQEIRVLSKNDGLVLFIADFASQA